MKNNQKNERNITSSEYYNELANNLNTYQSSVDGKTITIRHESDISTLSLIEEFVKRIISSNESGFLKKDKIKEKETAEVTFSSTKLSRYFKDMNSFMSTIRRYEQYYLYSEYVSIFQETCNDLKLPSNFFANPVLYIDAIKKYEADIYNELIESIRTKSKTKEFKKRFSNRKTNAERQQKSALQCIDDLFAKYSRLLVLRIDLSYAVKTNLSDKPLQLVTYEQVKKDLARFKNNWRHNKLFENLVGDIWKLEYGEEKGYHYHLILFFRGSKVCKDGYISDQIGKYWRDKITMGGGIFHNCNANKKKYFHLGIGMIDATAESDAELRANLRNVATYLTKNDQFLKIKLGKKDKVFGTGQVPEKTSNRGRPRKGT